ncbi:glucokinase [Sphingomonas sp. BN140010]|uniref:Glucokinase n=1 Tax=Sphingomonas arvum TaxID=2992113 RepID=A0ABT3JG61_9SPHN|nr:glucokinase [Sphingomonas sp. BN140010]MCW3798081.1 glucokinase [Sphingomonas sp. BN140010]
MRRIVTADVGGTHARFAVAELDGTRVARLSEALTLKTAEHASFETAWEQFGRQLGEPLPTELAMAFAGPVYGELLKLTNNPWVIRPALVAEQLGVERFTVVNDFGAVAHAVGALDGNAFTHLCGPDRPLPERGMITILGPGTGLGVAGLLRTDGRHEVIETEGGHIDFAPLDALEDRVLAELRRSFQRASLERLLSGPGLMNLYEALAAIEARPSTIHDEKVLWAAAMDRSDSLAVAALDRFCLTLGAAAGDLALAQGATAVAIGGGLGLRLAAHLPRSGFRDRFIAKGRFQCRMEDMPVKLITHPQPGLFGAAAAFARMHA